MYSMILLCMCVSVSKNLDLTKASKSMGPVYSAGLGVLVFSTLSLEFVVKYVVVVFISKIWALLVLGLTYKRLVPRCKHTVLFHDWKAGWKVLA